MQTVNKFTRLKANYGFDLLHGDAIVQFIMCDVRCALYTMPTDLFGYQLPRSSERAFVLNITHALWCFILHIPSLIDVLF